ncbi:MAG: hypothetical protein Q8873_04320 [Bacillota bacterium]|nr:hypothetical protein [Bacillota bacterium]
MDNKFINSDGQVLDIICFGGKNDSTFTIYGNSETGVLKKSILNHRLGNKYSREIPISQYEFSTWEDYANNKDAYVLNYVFSNTGKKLLNSIEVYNKEELERAVKKLREDYLGAGDVDVKESYIICEKYKYDHNLLRYYSDYIVNLLLEGGDKDIYVAYRTACDLYVNLSPYIKNKINSVVEENKDVLEKLGLLEKIFAMENVMAPYSIIKRAKKEYSVNDGKIIVTTDVFTGKHTLTAKLKDEKKRELSDKEFEKIEQAPEMIEIWACQLYNINISNKEELLLYKEEKRKKIRQMSIMAEIRRQEKILATNYWFPPFTRSSKKYCEAKSRIRMMKEELRLADKKIAK